MTREQEKRGAKVLDLHLVRNIIDGPGDPHFRFDANGITAYSLACTLIEYVDLNDDKFRTIQAYCKAASEDKAKITNLTAALKDFTAEHDSQREWTGGGKQCSCDNCASAKMAILLAEGNEL